LNNNEMIKMIKVLIMSLLLLQY